jgi:hypothetical protein
VVAPDFVTTTDLTDYKAGDPATLVSQAQSTIRAYCGWHVAPNITETVLLDGRGGSHLWLPSLHVTAVSSISNEGTVLTTAEYDWSVSGYVELRNWALWSSRPRQISVTFTHGYEDIPADLVGVAASIAARAGSSPAGIKRQSSGPFSAEYEVELLGDEKSTLGRYKLPPRT